MTRLWDSVICMRLADKRFRTEVMTLEKARQITRYYDPKYSPAQRMAAADFIGVHISEESNNAALAPTRTRIMGRRARPARRATLAQGRAVWLALITALILGGGIAFAEIWRGQDPISDIPTYSFGGASGIEGGYMLHLPVGNSLPDAQGI